MMHDGHGSGTGARVLEKPVVKNLIFAPPSVAQPFSFNCHSQISPRPLRKVYWPKSWAVVDEVAGAWCLKNGTTRRCEYRTHL